jgi:hypothetical protein
MASFVAWVDVTWNRCWRPQDSPPCSNVGVTSSANKAMVIRANAMVLSAGRYRLEITQHFWGAIVAIVEQSRVIAGRWESGAIARDGDEGRLGRRNRW